MQKKYLKYFKKKFKPEKSFALLGEDILIKSFFNPRYIGNYIDIGNAHPINGNNTFLFYKKGWRGLLIDPLNNIFYKPKRVRKEDLVFNYGIKEINDKRIKSDFFYKKSWPELSSTEINEFKYINDFFKDYMENDMILKKEIILIDANGIKKIFNYDYLDILSIDIEKNSENIVVDFIEIFNPKIIIYEKNKKDKINWKNYNYQLISENEMNRIIISNNHKQKNILEY